MIAFKNARVIDGTGCLPIDHATVIVSGARIEAVGPALGIPEDAVVIDLKGKTLLPAFSEAHTHFGGSDRLSRPALGGTLMRRAFLMIFSISTSLMSSKPKSSCKAMNSGFTSSEWSTAGASPRVLASLICFNSSYSCRIFLNPDFVK